jgi:hypothetical protein
MTFTFTRFDLYSWLPRTQTLLLLAFIAVVGIVLPVPGMAVVASAFVVSIGLSTPFLGDERGRLDTLYGVLPITRSAVVTGRTLAILAFALICAVVATAVTFAVALARGDQIPVEILLMAHAAAFAFIGLSMGLQLPVFFRVGYSRGRLMVYAPALTIAGLAWLGQATGSLGPIQAAASGIPMWLIIGAGFAFGAIAIVAGMLTAVRAFSRREL